jgi:hypothetical protein
MGAEIAALSGLFGLTSLFAFAAAAFAGWMAWRIVDKAGLPGWTGLGAILLTLTGIGSIVPLVLLWVFAFMRWPRDEVAGLLPGTAPPSRSGASVGAPAALPPPPQALPDRRSWRLSGTTTGGMAVSLVVDGSAAAYLLTGGPAAQSGELSVPDPSVGQPHARLLLSGARLGLQDLGSRGGTFIDGARLLPEHGARDISNARSIRLGGVQLLLSRA